MIPQPQTDVRELARVMLHLAQDRNYQDTIEASDAPAIDSTPAVALTGGGSDVHNSGSLDVPSGKNGTSVDDAAADTNDGEDGERIIFDNQAQVVWDGERGKWLVFDAYGQMHGMRRQRADAEAHAESLTGPTLMKSDGPDQQTGKLDRPRGRFS